MTKSIALRWIRSKKSHGAANIIAVTAVVGIAVAVAAIVCILSVFNGFREVLSSRLDTLNPDCIVVPAKGKVIEDGEQLAQKIGKVSGVERALPVVEEQALALFGGREMPVTLRGVPEESYKGMTGLDTILIAGKPEIRGGVTDFDEGGNGLPASGVLSIGTAVRLGNAMPGEKILLFAPRRVGSINIANPVNSFVSDSLLVSGVFEAKQSDFDRDMVIVPLSTARELFLYDNEAGRVEVKFKKGEVPADAVRKIEEVAGEGYIVKDRLKMQETNFKMVSIEKWVTFLLLFFILIIASFNIVSAMTMFVIDKDRSMSSLRAVGMTRRGIGSIFAWESVMVTGAGCVAGMILGLLLCLLQQRYGFLKLSGDADTLVMSSYPVRVVWSDLLIILVPVGIISIATALSASGFARRRLTRHQRRE